jgi:MFS family permease
MSTMTCTAPSASKNRTRLVTGPLALAFLAGFGALTSFELLLSVLPLYVAGTGSAGAGLVTGVLLFGTVAAEAGSAYLMNRFGYRASLAVGSVLLGAPALALVTHLPLMLVVATTLIRGFGFGLTTVVIGALVAELLPPQRRGEGLGLYGVVDGIPTVLALPAGLWLAGHAGYPLVAVMAAAAALISLAVAPLLPAMPKAAPSSTAPSSTSTAAVVEGVADEISDPGLLAAMRDRGQLTPALVFAATAMAGGVVVSFLPLARGVCVSVATTGLFAQALTATVGRWWAGRNGDRHGHARLLIPALILAVAGMGMLVLPSSPVMVIAGMCLFGAGFGIMQNAALALMMDRMPPAGLGTASALWNLAYDSGYGAGPAAFGLVVGRTGYPVGFGLTAALMLLALPASFRDKHHGQL